MFGAEYHKIQTIFKRDERGLIQPGEWSCPEFEYLSTSPWLWTEKVDGTNIRLHYTPGEFGGTVQVGGRTDQAQLPAKLVANLDEAGLTLAGQFKEIFGEDSATIYGEGYGAGIQKGGVYRPDQSLVIFDVKVGDWWLRREDVIDVASKLGLEVVAPVGRMTIYGAIELIKQEVATPGSLRSRWEGALMEGLVGKPTVDLFNRRGDRIVAKIKVKDFRDRATRNKKQEVSR